VRLGGIGFVLQEQIEKATGREARTVVLGHLQRGGSPTAADRVLSTQFGSHALELIMRGETGQMVAVHGCEITHVPLEVAARPDWCPGQFVLAAARTIGTTSMTTGTGPIPRTVLRRACTPISGGSFFEQGVEPRVAAQRIQAVKSDAGWLIFLS
jgi:hypothetical protein